MGDPKCLILRLDGACERCGIFGVEEGLLWTRLIQVIPNPGGFDQLAFSISALPSFLICCLLFFARAVDRGHVTDACDLPIETENSLKILPASEASAAT